MLVVTFVQVIRAALIHRSTPVSGTESSLSSWALMYLCCASASTKTNMSRHRAVVTHACPQLPNQSHSALAALKVRFSIAPRAPQSSVVHSAASFLVAVLAPRSSTLPRCRHMAGAREMSPLAPICPNAAPPLPAEIHCAITPKTNSLLCAGSQDPYSTIGHMGISLPVPLRGVIKVLFTSNAKLKFPTPTTKPAIGSRRTFRPVTT